uniref:Uncharacterized protein n=1 Tax=Avena sativa TaxID=4498 RepID=A0ACD5Z2R1_AVESA
MNGPKRAIDLYGTVFIEYDMKIKTGEEEKDDMQLIDGLSAIDDNGVWNYRAITRRIHGDSGAVDITVLRLKGAVEGTVEVSISEVKCSFSLCLGCILNTLDEEICLFDGTIGESSVLERSVVAVIMGSMDLKFRVGSESCTSAQVCSFQATHHGVSTQQIETDFALISVKVTWSTLR